MHLYIAYKNYSSWSLRPWLAMKVAGIEFEETVLPFFHTDELKQITTKLEIPAKVPFLEDNGLLVWDSMAMMEYLAEQFPDKGLWPLDLSLRTLARCAAAEMHSGFAALRNQFPMNCRLEGKIAPSAESQKDLDRLAEIWQKFAVLDTDGPFLCGAFSIVDAMYAPVMWRVRNYGLFVSDAFSAWIEAMYALPAMQEWLAAARAEEWQVEHYDAVAKG